MTHTPGPWIVEPTPMWPETPLAIAGANGFRPCLIYSDGRLNRGTAAANARLIAAAPQMAELLRRFITDMPDIFAINIESARKLLAYVDDPES